MKTSLALLSAFVALAFAARADEPAIQTEAVPAEQPAETVQVARITRPVVVKQVAPQVEAPATAGLGKVRFLVNTVVNAEGRALEPKVLDSAAPEFDKAVAAAVAQWKFKPALAGETPVAMAVVVPVDVDFAAIQERFLARR